MHTLADIAKALNRPAVVISALQARFNPRGFDDAAYIGTKQYGHQ